MLLDRFETYFSMVLDRDEPPIMEDGFSPFMASASCYKHQGFIEECEVRAVIVPGTQQVADQVRAENPGVTLNPLKEISTDERGRKFITLFPTLDRKLPIKRIIVGPSAHQAANAQRAIELVGDSIPVTLSETPYVG